MTELILRWNIGENNAFKLSPQAFEMLKYSIGFSILIFENYNNNVRFIVCHNNLDKKSKGKIEKICKTYNVESLDVSNELPVELRKEKVKNSWWKYAIPRIDINSYEIIMDNDIIIWKLPSILNKAINSLALIALRDGVGKFYGDFLEDINEFDEDLNLNAGLLGCPPGFEINPNKIINNLPQDFFFSEQGFTALQFAKHEGEKLLIPLSEIQQLNANRISSTELINHYCGGHFCGCSYDIEDFWNKIYSKSIKDKYKELINN